MYKTSIKFAGSGGQGIITTAILLAQAAVTTGLNAVQSQSYGPEARGGACQSEVIISSNKIYHPKIITPDHMFIMSSTAFDKYHDCNNHFTHYIVDSLVEVSFMNIKHLPIMSMAIQKFHNKLVANLILLGVCCKLLEIIPLDVVITILANHFRTNIDTNMQALISGYNLVIR